MQSTKCWAKFRFIDTLTKKTKFEIQPTISPFKIVQNFYERCHWKAHFPCFRMLHLFYHGKYSCAWGNISINI